MESEHIAAGSGGAALLSFCLTSHGVVLFLLFSCQDCLVWGGGGDSKPNPLKLKVVLFFISVNSGHRNQRGQSASDVTNTTVCARAHTHTHTLTHTATPRSVGVEVQRSWTGVSCAWRPCSDWTTAASTADVLMDCSAFTELETLQTR